MLLGIDYILNLALLISSEVSVLQPLLLGIADNQFVESSNSDSTYQIFCVLWPSVEKGSVCSL